MVRSGLPDCQALIRMDPSPAMLQIAASGAPCNDSPRTSGGGCAVSPGLGDTADSEGTGLPTGVEYGSSWIPKMQPARIGPQRTRKATARYAIGSLGRVIRRRCREVEPRGSSHRRSLEDERRCGDRSRVPCGEPSHVATLTLLLGARIAALLDQGSPIRRLLGTWVSGDEPAAQRCRFGSPRRRPTPASARRAIGNQAAPPASCKSTTRTTSKPGNPKATAGTVHAPRPS
jgi:hypothetical protein